MPFWPLSGSPLAEARGGFSVSASRNTIPGNAIAPRKSAGCHEPRRML
jgi:hypothetical protein